MNSFTVLLFCIQACLVQNVLSQCNCGSSGLASISPASISYGHGCGGILGSAAYTGIGGLGYGIGGSDLMGSVGGSSYGGSSAAAYGGVGEGNVAVIGELPVSGTTAVIGHVPVLGAVNFCGSVPAAGSVVINGQCSCGCGY